MKEVLDGYIGVKFEATQLDTETPAGTRDLFPLFKRNAQRLKEFGMTPRNGGNMSVKAGRGLTITSSGSNLGSLEEDEIVFVASCSIESGTVAYLGSRRPSSETFMHYLVYECRSDAAAVVHAHDPATAAIPIRKIRETAREEPYGTLALARIACGTFSKHENIIVLKNHGYVAIGQSLTAATDLVVTTHLRLVT